MVWIFAAGHDLAVARHEVLRVVGAHPVHRGDPALDVARPGAAQRVQLREGRPLDLVTGEDDALVGQVDADVARRLAAGVEEQDAVAGERHLGHASRGRRCWAR